MDLIERYVFAIGRRLPARQRADIERELKSLIQDSLDARTGGAEPTTADVTAVLRELGHPAKVAANYTQEGRYLIGPRLFEIYRLVAPIVVGAVVLGLAVAFAVETIGSGGRVDIFRFVGTLFSGCISAVGSVTIMFAIGERLLPDSDKPLVDNNDWDPQDLPPVVPPRQQIKLAEPIVAICFTALAMAVFNLFPHVLSLRFLGVEAWQSVPLLNPAALSAYLPLWNISWALTIAFNGLLLATGRRSTLLNVFDVALSVFSIVILVFMQRGPMLISPALADVSGLARLTDLIASGYRVSLMIITVIAAIDGLKKVYVAIRSAVETAA